MAKKAVLVGINYLNTINELHGCANDILAMRELIKKNGYTDENICMISDDISKTTFPSALYPDKKTILAELTRLVTTARAGDEIIFHYSGHGTETIDRNHDEADGEDEAIYPVKGGIITDDEMKAIVDKLAIGAKLFVLMDCCHSSSILDLEHNLSKVQTKLPDNLNHGYTFLMSGCADNKTSADAVLNNKPQGAMTAAFLALVESKKGLTNVLNICFSTSVSQIRKMRTTMINFMKSHHFSQRPDFSYEGTLPANAPVLTGYQVAKSQYALRQTSSRDARIDREYQPVAIRL